MNKTKLYTCECVTIDGNLQCGEQLRTNENDQQDFCSFFISEMVENVNILLDFVPSSIEWANWKHAEINAVSEYIRSIMNKSFSEKVISEYALMYRRHSY